MKEEDCITIFNAAVKAVKPGVLIPQYLQANGNTIVAGESTFLYDDIEEIYVLSVGKAAAAMAAEVEKVLGNNVTAGLVITKYHHSLPLRYCTTIEAGHPVPDENSVAAAKAVIDFLQRVKPASLLLCCISGGASALLGDVAEGISLEDMQQLSSLLLQCGADIQDINILRKHLCTLKGGQLIKHANGAYVVSFIISDVPGDYLSVIASGLTVADNSTFANAWNVLEKHGLTDKVPASIRAYLQDGLANNIAETPKPGDALFDKVRNYIIGSNAIALQAAAAKAAKLGYAVQVVNNNLHGEAKDEAKKFIAMLLQNDTKGTCLLMGGETTVTIKGKGKGGRNQEFVLAALCELKRLSIFPGHYPAILSGGTDGTDGPTDATGAYTNRLVVLKMHALSGSPEVYLQNNDAYHFFEQTGGLLVTGPTQTNVMDIVIGLNLL